MISLINLTKKSNVNKKTYKKSNVIVNKIIHINEKRNIKIDKELNTVVNKNINTNRKQITIAIKRLKFIAIKLFILMRDSKN